MTIPQHEIDIIQRLQNGDQQGVSLLYQHYGAAIYGIVIRIVNHEETAQEVIQDVFLKAWKYAKKYDSRKGRLYTWLAQIARNTSLTKVHSGAFSREMKTDSLDPVVYDNEQLTEEHKIDDSGLQHVISKLDAKHRLLIDYIYYQGYSQREAAEALSLPVGTVKTRIRTAIKELRRILGNDISVISILFVMMIESLL